MFRWGSRKQDDSAESKQRRRSEAGSSSKRSSRRDDPDRDGRSSRKERDPTSTTRSLDYEDDGSSTMRTRSSRAGSVRDPGSGTARRSDSTRDDRTDTRDSSKMEDRKSSRSSGQKTRSRSIDIDEDRAVATKKTSSRSALSDRAGPQEPPGNQALVSNVPNQFPDQTPLDFSMPFQPGPSGNFGAAADYYGDQGESVAHQPGIRPATPMLVGGEPHLMPASAEPAPPQETGSGAAAEFYSADAQETFQSTTVNSASSTRPPRPTPSSSNSQPPRPPLKPSSSLPLYAAGAIGAAGLSAAASSYYTAHETGVSGSSAVNSNMSGRPPMPQSGHSHSQSFAHTHNHAPSGPLGKLVDWWNDYEDVRKMEEYTEYIGVCRYCFDPRSSPHDAPRAHRPRKTPSRESLNRRRVDKERRYSTVDTETTRKSNSTWIPAAIAGYGIAQIGNVFKSPGSDSDGARRQSAQLRRDGKRKVGSPSRLPRRSVSDVDPRFSNSASIEQASRSDSRYNDSVIASAAAASTTVDQRSQMDRRSSDRLPRRRSSSGSDANVGFFGRFFSPPRKQRVKHRPSRQHGIYSESNTSSSSIDAGLAFGSEQRVLPRNDKGKRRNRRSSDENARNALLGLGAAAAALAAHDARRNRPGLSRNDVVAVKESKRRPINPSGYAAPPSHRLAGSDEENWESASEEDDAVSVDSALAFGGSALRKSTSRRSSSSSHSSRGSGTDKWGWRWGRRPSKQPDPRTTYQPTVSFSGRFEPQPAHRTPPGEPPTSVSPATIAEPLRYVEPIPVEGSEPLTPILKSQASNVPLEQPQPQFPGPRRSYTEPVQPYYPSVTFDDSVYKNSDRVSRGDTRETSSKPSRAVRDDTGDRQTGRGGLSRSNGKTFAGVAAAVTAGAVVADAVRKSGGSASSRAKDDEPAASSPTIQRKIPTGDDYKDSPSARIDYRSPTSEDSPNAQGPGPAVEVRRARNIQDEDHHSDDERFDPDYFRRRKRVSESKRTEDDATSQVFADLEERYNQKPQTSAEIFAPGLMDKSGESASNEQQKPWNPEEEVFDIPPSVARFVPSLKVIAPTPPQSTAGSVRGHSPAASPLRQSQELEDEDRNVNPSEQHSDAVEEQIPDPVRNVPISQESSGSSGAVIDNNNQGREPRHETAKEENTSKFYQSPFAETVSDLGYTQSTADDTYAARDPSKGGEATRDLTEKAVTSESATKSTSFEEASQAASVEKNTRKTADKFPQPAAYRSMMPDFSSVVDAAMTAGAGSRAKEVSSDENANMNSPPKGQKTAVNEPANRDEPRGGSPGFSSVVEAAMSSRATGAPADQSSNGTGQSKPAKDTGATKSPSAKRDTSRSEASGFGSVVTAAMMAGAASTVAERFTRDSNDNAGSRTPRKVPGAFDDDEQPSSSPLDGSSKTWSNTQQTRDADAQSQQFNSREETTSTTAADQEQPDGGEQWDPPSNKKSKSKKSKRTSSGFSGVEESKEQTNAVSDVVEMLSRGPSSGSADIMYMSPENDMGDEWGGVTRKQSKKGKKQARFSDFEQPERESGSKSNGSHEKGVDVWQYQVPPDPVTQDDPIAAKDEGPEPVDVWKYQVRSNSPTQEPQSTPGNQSKLRDAEEGRATSGAADDFWEEELPSRKSKKSQKRGSKVDLGDSQSGTREAPERQSDTDILEKNRGHDADKRQSFEVETGRQSSPDRSTRENGSDDTWETGGSKKSKKSKKQKNRYSASSFDQDEGTGSGSSINDNFNEKTIEDAGAPGDAEWTPPLSKKERKKAAKRSSLLRDATTRSIDSVPLDREASNGQGDWQDSADDVYETGRSSQMATKVNGYPPSMGLVVDLGMQSLILSKSATAGDDPPRDAAEQSPELHGPTNASQESYTDEDAAPSLSPGEIPSVSSRDLAVLHMYGNSVERETSAVPTRIAEPPESVHSRVQSTSEPGFIAAALPAFTDPSLSRLPARQPSSTAVPLRFRRPPVSPSTPRDVAQDTTSQSATSSPNTPSRVRQPRPASTEFRNSSEFRPLYLVERNTKLPSPESSLPSLPSSRTSSRAPSVQESDDIYESAVESPSTRQVDDPFERYSEDGYDRVHGQFLDSGQTTPKAGQSSPKAQTDELSQKQEQVLRNGPGPAFDENQKETEASRDTESKNSRPQQSKSRVDIDLAAAAALISAGISQLKSPDDDKESSRPSQKVSDDLEDRSQQYARPKSLSISAHADEDIDNGPVSAKWLPLHLDTSEHTHIPALDPTMPHNKPNSAKDLENQSLEGVRREPQVDVASVERGSAVADLSRETDRQASESDAALVEAQNLPLPAAERDNSEDVIDSSHDRPPMASLRHPIEEEELATGGVTHELEQADDPTSVPLPEDAIEDFGEIERHQSEEGDRGNDDSAEPDVPARETEKKVSRKSSVKTKAKTTSEESSGSFWNLWSGKSKKAAKTEKKRPQLEEAPQPKETAPVPTEQVSVSDRDTALSQADETAETSRTKSRETEGVTSAKKQPEPAREAAGSSTWALFSRKPSKKEKKSKKATGKTARVDPERADPERADPERADPEQDILQEKATDGPPPIFEPENLDNAAEPVEGPEREVPDNQPTLEPKSIATDDAPNRDHDLFPGGAEESQEKGAQANDTRGETPMVQEAPRTGDREDAAEATKEAKEGDGSDGDDWNVAVSKPKKRNSKKIKASATQDEEPMRSPDKSAKAEDIKPQDGEDGPKLNVFDFLEEPETPEDPQIAEQPAVTSRKLSKKDKKKAKKAQRAVGFDDIDSGSQDSAVVQSREDSTDTDYAGSSGAKDVEEAMAATTPAKPSKKGSKKGKKARMADITMQLLQENRETPSPSAAAEDTLQTRTDDAGDLNKDDAKVDSIVAAAEDSLQSRTDDTGDLTKEDSKIDSLTESLQSRTDDASHLQDSSKVDSATNAAENSLQSRIEETADLTQEHSKVDSVAEAASEGTRQRPSSWSRGDDAAYIGHSSDHVPGSFPSDDDGHFTAVRTKEQRLGKVELEENPETSDLPTSIAQPKESSDDFTATLAAGLAGAGFDPSLAHADESPSAAGVKTAEDENFEEFQLFSSSKKKKKGKKQEQKKKRESQAMDLDSLERGDAYAASAVETAKPSNEQGNEQGQRKPNGPGEPDTSDRAFEDIIAAGLNEAGFDPETATLHGTAPTEDASLPRTRDAALEFGTFTGSSKDVEGSRRTPSPTQAWQSGGSPPRALHDENIVPSQAQGSLRDQEAASTKEATANDRTDEDEWAISKKKKKGKKAAKSYVDDTAITSGAVLGAVVAMGSADAAEKTQEGSTPSAKSKKNKKKRGSNYIPWEEEAAMPESTEPDQPMANRDSGILVSESPAAAQQSWSHDDGVRDSGYQDSTTMTPSQPHFDHARGSNSPTEAAEAVTAQIRENSNMEAGLRGVAPTEGGTMKEMETPQRPTENRFKPSPEAVDAATRARASDLFTSPPNQSHNPEARAMADWQKGTSPPESPESGRDQTMALAAAEAGRQRTSNLDSIDEGSREVSPSRAGKGPATRASQEAWHSSWTFPKEAHSTKGAEDEAQRADAGADKAEGTSQRPERHERTGGASPLGSEVANTRRAYMQSPVLDAGRPFSGMSNHSRAASATSNRSGTPSLRRMESMRSVSSDVRAAAKRDGTLAQNNTPPEKPPNYEPLRGPGKDRRQDMADGGVLVSLAPAAGAFDDDSRSQSWQEAMGDARESPLSPTRPPSMRKRQSMQIIDLETRLDQLVAENQALQEAKSRSRRGYDDAMSESSSPARQAIESRELQLREKDVEIHSIRTSLQTLQTEITRLTERNMQLQEANDTLSNDINARYATLQQESDHAHSQWQESTRQLEELRDRHGQLNAGMEDVVRQEISTALQHKDAEISDLRAELDEATDRIAALQKQISQSGQGDDFLNFRNEDYFDSACQQLCQHVQQWVLRFSKFSDTRASRLSAQVNDEKIETRLDNAILDGTDVDQYLMDRVARRDVFMSVVMTMIWEFVFTRYLFGMDRDQRQKLKALEKTLSEVGPARAVAQWRATTLSLLSRREAFFEQRSQDTDAVVHEIYRTLERLLPPPSHLAKQVQDSLRNVMSLAVDLSIEMRTQRAEYIMLPPLQPEFDTNGDLARKVFFNAALMNERSGETSSNEQLEEQQAIVRTVLFPLVVKKGNEMGETDEEVVVCPAQVLVSRPPKDRKSARIMGGVGGLSADQANRSVQSFAPSTMGSGNAV